MSKQDGYSSRTAVDLERKYNFGKTFAEVYGLVSDAQRTANEAQAAFDNLSHEQIFNLLTNYGEFQGIYRGDDGGVYVNASYIKSGEIAAERIDLNKLIVTRAENDDEEDLTFGDLFGKVGLESNMTTIVGGIITTDYVNALGITVTDLNIKGRLSFNKLPEDVASTGAVGTIIEDFLIASPTIKGGKFFDDDNVGKLELSGLSYDGGIIYQIPALDFKSADGKTKIFTVSRDLDDSFTELYLSGAKVLESNASPSFVTPTNTVRAYGQWDFSNAYSVDFGGQSAADLGITFDASDIDIDLSDISISIIGDESCYVEASDRVWVGNHMYPAEADEFNCGNANFPWAMVYSTNGMCETSDRNKKKDISYGLDSMDGFFDDLQPSLYRMKKGTSGRKHCGFVAQDIKSNLDKHGISTQDFGGYVASKDEEGNETYGLRYSEFIPLLVDQVQKLKARVGELEGNKHGQKN